MSALDRRRLLIGAGLVLGAGATQVLRPRRLGRPAPQSALERALPQQVGQWRAVKLADFVLPAPDALGQSIYDAQYVQGFVNTAGQKLYCVIAYGGVQDYAQQLHRPEVCYPASGFIVRETRPLGGIGMAAAGLPDVRPSLLVADRGDRTETVLFWTRVGRAYPASQWQVRAEIARGLADFTIPDGVLVRLSMALPPDRETEAMLAEFAVECVRSLSPAARALVLGG